MTHQERVVLEEQIRDVLEARFGITAIVPSNPEEMRKIYFEQATIAILSLIEQIEAEAYKKGYVDGVLANQPPEEKDK